MLGEQLQLDQGGWSRVASQGMGHLRRSAQSMPQVICTSVPSWSTTVEFEGTRGDLMEALDGAASHKPITNPTTGRATVYLEASTAGCVI
jgi:hypothetical protein